ncbi:MAG TPA: energy transducer TonB [Bacteroidia bacterium]|nr:energy transducer TonB [Bacteroidia bacterium]
MKTIQVLFISMLLVAPLAAVAQSGTETSAQNEEQVFTTVEQMPVFPGGEKAMYQFITENIKYPEDAIQSKSEGVVFVNFIISATGQVTQSKVLRGFDPSCDIEALRVINLMPDWQPGSINNKNVPVSLNLPVRFKLN